MTDLSLAAMNLPKIHQDLKAMTDLEMTKLCAEAMGMPPEAAEPCSGQYLPKPTSYSSHWSCRCGITSRDSCKRGRFEPLVNDKHAMALVKRFALDLATPIDNGKWCCVAYIFVGERLEERERAFNADLNRAIVECVAQMQRSQENARSK